LRLALDLTDWACHQVQIEWTRGSAEDRKFEKKSFQERCPDSMVFDMVKLLSEIDKLKGIITTLEIRNNGWKKKRERLISDLQAERARNEHLMENNEQLKEKLKYMRTQFSHISCFSKDSMAKCSEVFGDEGSESD
jgi:hypothetical protein